MDVTAKNILLQEITRRQARNSAYSLRAFARDLGLGVTTLSDVLASKRSLSKTNLAKILEKLAVSPFEADQLWAAHQEKFKKAPAIEHSLLEDDQFRLIADWYYLAILNLAKVKENKASPAWVGERLGIEPRLAEEALERLQRLGLLQITKKKLVRTSRPLTTSREIPSAAIRKHHSQNLLKAGEALENLAVSARDFGSVTMAVNMKNLPKAKDLLLKTRKKMADLLEQGPTTEVYTLAFQLFPLTKVQTVQEDRSSVTKDSK